MKSERYISKDRLNEFGEYFTPPNIVDEMIEMVDSQLQRVDSRFLEPACGTGNFLIPVLESKLKLVSSKYRKIPFEYEQQAILALSSIYGIEIQEDTAAICRDRLFSLWEREYQRHCRKQYDPDTVRTAQFILERNIVCGDALTMLDIHGNPIVFSEWSFIMPRKLQRRDFLYKHLGTDNDSQEETDTMLYQKVSDYRRIWENVD